MLPLVLAILSFVSLSGLMALIESAVLSVTRAEIDELHSAGHPGAPALITVTSRLTRTLAVLVILTNTINILGPILVTRQAIAAFGDTILGLLTALLTILTIVFSEVIPKSLGARGAPRIAAAVAPVLLALTTLLLPVAWLLERLTERINTGERRLGTEDQIRSLVGRGARKGYIEDDEHELITRVFKLNDRTARDVMAPLEAVCGLSSAATVEEAVQTVMTTEHSRYPVFGETPDEVRGITRGRDVLRAFTDGEGGRLIGSLARPGLLVSADTRTDLLIERFRDARTQLAVVRDAGRTIGIVTLEDVIAELVGEIADEDPERRRSSPAPQATDDGPARADSGRSLCARVRDEADEANKEPDKEPDKEPAKEPAKQSEDNPPTPDQGESP